MSLFIGNISHNVRTRDLEDEFDKFGPCTIKHRGSYAFVEYDDERDAEDAMNDLQNKNMGGLRINIEWSKRSGKYDPKSSNRPARRDRSEVKCFQCGEYGHFARECRNHRPHQRGRRSRSRSFSPKRDRDGRRKGRRSPTPTRRHHRRHSSSRSYRKRSRSRSKERRNERRGDRKDRHFRSDRKERKYRDERDEEDNYRKNSDKKSLSPPKEEGRRSRSKSMESDIQKSRSPSFSKSPSHHSHHSHNSSHHSSHHSHSRSPTPKKDPSIERKSRSKSKSPYHEPSPRKSRSPSPAEDKNEIEMEESKPEIVDEEPVNQNSQNTGLDFQKMKVTELQDELKKRGLETKGKKAILIERLEEAMKNE